MYFFSITYDKYFPEYDKDGIPKSNLYLIIGPNNQDQQYSREYFVYDWTTFFADMGSYTGLLLGLLDFSKENLSFFIIHSFSL